MRYIPALTAAVLALSTVFGFALLSSALAHRDGCHRWHSCESDRGTYVCGDLGYDTYCDKRSSSVLTVPATVSAAQNKIALWAALLALGGTPAVPRPRAY